LVLYLIMKKYFLSFLFTFLIISSFALTWDEPWHDKVVKEADYFVLARVKNYDTANGILVTIIKTIGGKEITGDIIINDFYLLKICSYSGGQRYPRVKLNGVDSCFFFLKNINDTFSIATPTTGFAVVAEGRVTATYRHSYHQAAVDVETYLKTQAAIFSYYHNMSYDKSFIEKFVDSKLSLKPAGFSEQEINQFFEQHAALEVIYHLQLSGFYEKILPFLNYKENRHTQISAARALRAYNSKEKNMALLKIIQEGGDDDFLKVICIWSLNDISKYGMTDDIKKIIPKASEEPNGFGGNIMDNRVCTRMPKVKDALEELLGKSK
jgi:hypothetical protein